VSFSPSFHSNPSELASALIALIVRVVRSFFVPALASSAFFPSIPNIATDVGSTQEVISEFSSR